MTIIDNENRPKRRFVEIGIGEVFKHMGNYFLKVRYMFLYDDIDDYLCDGDITEISQLEDEYDVINAICLSDGSYTMFEKNCVVEPLVAELHIVM